MISHPNLEDRTEHDANNANDGGELAVVVDGARLASGAAHSAEAALTVMLGAARSGAVLRAANRHQ